jgi:hypothetical protein
MHLRSRENDTPKYHLEHGSPDDAVKGLSSSDIFASDSQDAIADKPTSPVAHLPATNSQRSSANKKAADGGGVGTTIVQPSSRHPQPTTGSPQQSQVVRSQEQQPPAGLQRPVLLDLQREYSIVRERVIRKDIASGLPAIASVAALRSCMADLKDAAKMNSEAWFLMEREKIDEELIQGGFVGLPTI